LYTCTWGCHMYRVLMWQGGWWVLQGQQGEGFLGVRLIPDDDDRPLFSALSGLQLAVSAGIARVVLATAERTSWPQLVARAGQLGALMSCMYTAIATRRNIRHVVLYDLHTAYKPYMRLAILQDLRAGLWNRSDHYIATRDSRAQFDICVHTLTLRAAHCLPTNNNNEYDACGKCVCGHALGCRFSM